MTVFYTYPLGNAILLYKRTNKATIYNNENIMQTSLKENMY